MADGSVVRALAVGNYYWLARGLARAYGVAAEINAAATRVRSKQPH